MNKRDLISVIVPCYNEEESLPLFYIETGKVLHQITEVDYEIIFVDDGSSDKTRTIMKNLAEKDEKVRYVVFSRNFGKEAAMYAGLKEARGDYSVIMDADLQHPPALLPEMYKVVSCEDYDCCGGLRLSREGDGFLRSLFSKAFYKISKGLTHMDMTDGHGDFRMMNRTVVNAILEMKEYNRYMKGLFSFVGFDTKWIEYEGVERAMGCTKWSFKSLFAYAFEGILSFSTAPLKAAGLMGIFLFLAGMVFMGCNLIQSIWVPGAVSSLDVILFVVLLLGSLQMLFIYILGAYLSKDYLENKRRPIYIVKEKSC
ncbi:glycosyltransferase family 2 protein [Anaerovoracaceae bacterium 41-7]|jgi:glycosyltransferase involved in cell wall biosynthesis